MNSPFLTVRKHCSWTLRGGELHFQPTRWRARRSKSLKPAEQFQNCSKINFIETTLCPQIIKMSMSTIGNLTISEHDCCVRPAAVFRQCSYCLSWLCGFRVSSLNTVTTWFQEMMCENEWVRWVIDRSTSIALPESYLGGRLHSLKMVLVFCCLSVVNTGCVLAFLNEHVSGLILILPEYPFSRV